MFYGNTHNSLQKKLSKPGPNICLPKIVGEATVATWKPKLGTYPVPGSTLGGPTQLAISLRSGALIPHSDPPIPQPEGARISVHPPSHLHLRPLGSGHPPCDDSSGMQHIRSIIYMLSREGGQPTTRTLSTEVQLSRSHSVRGSWRRLPGAAGLASQPVPRWHPPLQLAVQLCTSSLPSLSLLCPIFTYRGFAATSESSWKDSL